jgi:hypothetical protein
VQRLAADPPVATADLFDDDPGDGAHASIETIASVRRSTICPFCSDVNTPSISLTLMSGIAPPPGCVWLAARNAIAHGTTARNPA